MTQKSLKLMNQDNIAIYAIPLSPISYWLLSLKASLVTTVIERVSVETVLLTVQMMKKNTILRFMGELSGRYLKLVFPEIEPHKCVKNNEKKEQRKVKRRQVGSIYIILIEGTEERKEKTDEIYK